MSEDDIPDYKLQENNRSKGEQAEEIPFSDATSFYETLKEQLSERDLTEHQRELAEYLIGSLDDDGLLRKSLDSICDELAIYAGIECTQEELEEALKIIPGIQSRRDSVYTQPQVTPLIQIHRKIEATALHPAALYFIYKKRSSPTNVTKNLPVSIGTRYSRSSDWKKMLLNRLSKRSANSIRVRVPLWVKPSAGTCKRYVPHFIVDTHDAVLISLASETTETFRNCV